MAVEWVGLGVAVVKIAMRLHGEPDFSDAIDDASGPLLALRGNSRKQRDLAGVIASLLRGEVLGQLGHDSASDTEQEAAVAIATQVVTALAAQPNALVAALTHPENFPKFVVDHGGSAARAELVAERAEPLYDRVLKSAAKQIVALAPTSQRANSAGIAELLRQSEQFSEDLGETRAGVTELLDTTRSERRLIERGRVEAVAEALPPYLAAEIVELLDRIPELADLAESLADSSAPARMLQRSAVDPPPWLDDAPGRVWVLLGNALSSFGADGAAADAFQAAVRRGVADPDQIEALAALTLQSREEEGPLTEEVDGRIVSLLTDNPSVMAQMLVAARAREFTAAYHLAEQLPHRTPREREQRAALLTNFLTTTERYPEAERILRDHLGAAQGAGLHLLLSDRLRRDVEQRRSANRSASLLEALELALVARQRRRAWRGDAIPAILAAVEAAWALDDDRLVHKLVTPAPAGEATEVEAADSRLLAVRALAAANSDDEALALRLAGQLDDFPRLRVEAICVTRRRTADPTSSEVKAAWRAAWDAAANDAERVAAARGLLTHGATAPGMADLRQAQPEAMAEIDAIAQAVMPRPGESSKARQHRLRRSARANTYAGIELGYALAHEGQTRAAAAAWSEMADLADDQRWRLRAASLLLEAGERSAAVTTAENALSRSPSDWPGRRQAHALAIEASANEQDWDVAASHARQLLLLDSSPDVRWILVHALCELDDAAGAWPIIDQGGSVLEPVAGPLHRLQTSRRLELVSQFGTRTQLLACAADALRDYRDDEAASAQILGRVFTSEARHTPGDSSGEEPSDHVTEGFKALTAEFLERFPNSTHFRALTFNADDPSEFIATLSAELAPRAAVMRELETKVRAGEFPVGALAAAVDRSYAEIHVLRSAQDGTYLRRADPALESKENDDLSSTLAVGTPAVLIDASALHTLTWLSDQTRSECLGLLDPCLTRAAFDDLKRGRNALNRQGTGSLSYDTDAERLVLTEWDQQQARDLAAEGADLVRLGQTLRQVHGVDEYSLQLPGDIRPWLGLVSTCRAQNLALWTDDVVLRDIARSERVPTFGTYTLLTRLHSDGVLTTVELEAALFDLTQHRGLDLPIQLERLKLVAATERWRPDAAALVLTRPAAWVADSAACLSLLSEACAHRSTNPPELATWVARAVLGLSASIGDAEHGNRAVATLLAKLLLAPEVTPQASRAILDGTRAATTQRQAADPWPLAVDLLRDILLRVRNGEECRIIMGVLAANLEQEDQRIVFRALLAITPNSAG